jgi:hypothetical protein
MLGKKILSTKDTPEIILNPEGIITIRGRSMNGNFAELGGQIEDWIDKYLNSPAELTFVVFHMEYFNKVNSKVFISMIKKIETLSQKNKKYIINWYYDEGDEDILEKGEFLSLSLNIPFNFIEVNDSLMVEYISPEMAVYS